MDVRLTQEITLHVPKVAFLLSSVIIGIVVTTLFSWVQGFKKYFTDMKTRKDFQKEIDDRMFGEQIFEKAENAGTSSGQL